MTDCRCSVVTVLALVGLTKKRFGHYAFLKTLSFRSPRKQRADAEKNTAFWQRFELKFIVKPFLRKIIVSDLILTPTICGKDIQNFHEILDINQLAPKIMSTCCYCVPSLDTMLLWSKIKFTSKGGLSIQALQNCQQRLVSMRSL